MAKTGSERVKELRAKRRAAGLCARCGVESKTWECENCKPEPRPDLEAYGDSIRERQALQRENARLKMDIEAYKVVIADLHHLREQVDDGRLIPAPPLGLLPQASDDLPTSFEPRPVA